MKTPVPTSSNSSRKVKKQFKIYKGENGIVPFWDDPSVYGGLDRPENYRPKNDMMKIVSDFYHGRFFEEDNLILCLIRDAICLNENQLRRLLKGKLTSRYLSQRLRTMQVYGLTDKWKLRSRDEKASLPPSPWSVGTAGYLYLKHMYLEFCMHPERMETKAGLKGVQRYVALNEIRTQFYEYQALRDWKWHSVINQNPMLGKPLAAATIKGPNNDFNIVIERLQQSQAFLGYIRDRFENWKIVYEEQQYLPIMDLKTRPTIVCLSVCTEEMAEDIVSKLPEYPFPIWFIIDEHLFQGDITQSILLLDNGQLKPLKLDFLEKR